MPLYCYVGHDAPDSAAKRPGARPAHLAHLGALADAGRVQFAGPLLDDQGVACGSLVVIDGDSYADVRQIADADPYVAHGVFERVDVYETRQVLPAPAED